MKKHLRICTVSLAIFITLNTQWVVTELAKTKQYQNEIKCELILPKFPINTQRDQITGQN